MSDRRPTARELQVLELLELPYASATSVADALGISPRTVNAHLASLYGKLGVSSALQARAALDRAEIRGRRRDRQKYLDPRSTVAGNT